MIVNLHRAMRISVLLLTLCFVTLCSCERSSKYKLGGVGRDPALISNQEALRIGMQLLTNRYPDAQVIEELGGLQSNTYRFTTSGVVSPLAVVVDLKNRKAKFERLEILRH